MYCRKCGSKILENAKFCTHCGAEVIPPETDTAAAAGENVRTGFDAPPEMNCESGGTVDYQFVQDIPVQKPKKELGTLWRLLMTLCGVLSALLVLSDWFLVSYSAFFSRGVMRFSLFQAAKLSEFLQDAVGLRSAAVPILLCVAATGLVMAVLLMTAGWIGGWMRKNRAAALSVTGSLLGFLVTVFVLIMTQILNFSFGRYAGAFNQSIFSVTSAPWLLLLVFAANLVFTVCLLHKEKLSVWLPSIIISGLCAVGILLIAAVLSIGANLFFGHSRQEQQLELFPDGIFDDFSGESGKGNSTLYREAK